MLPQAYCVYVCVCRERERKLEARNAAIQTSVEELERKIQQKVMCVHEEFCNCFY